MNKYIDAERLKAEIERQKHELELSIQSQGDYGQSCHIVAYENILSLIDSFQQEQPAKRSYKDCNGCEYNRRLKDQIGWQFQGCFGGDYKGKPIAEIELCPLKLAVQQEQSEVGLEKFTEKIKTFQERYEHSVVIPIKGAMAFMARMFYQYPNIAREWYESLTKATMDKTE